jgi:hypothetical protein
MLARVRCKATHPILLSCDWVQSLDKQKHELHDGRTSTSFLLLMSHPPPDSPELRAHEAYVASEPLLVESYNAFPGSEGDALSGEPRSAEVFGGLPGRLNRLRFVAPSCWFFRNAPTPLMLNRYVSHKTMLACEESEALIQEFGTKGGKVSSNWLACSVFARFLWAPGLHSTSSPCLMYVRYCLRQVKRK